jgi:hypothetical protein
MAHVLSVYNNGKKTSVSVDSVLWHLFIALHEYDESAANSSVRNYLNSLGVVESKYARQFIILCVSSPFLVDEVFGMDVFEIGLEVLELYND